MEGVAPRWQTLAGRLVEHESAGRHDALALGQATERVCARLADRLVPLIGPEGFRILLANAVDLTRTEHAFLQAVGSRVDVRGCLVGLGDALRDRAGAEAMAAVTALLGRFMQLLGGFIGEALTARLIERAWPEVDWTARAIDDREKRG